MIMLDIGDLNISNMRNEELKTNIYILKYRIQRLSKSLEFCNKQLEKLTNEQKRRIKDEKNTQ